MLVDPVTSLLPLVYRPSPAGVASIALVWTLLGFYSLLLALQSPHPLFEASPGLGGTVVVGSCVLRAALLAYTKVMANYHLKVSAASAEAVRHDLELSGTMMQVGATVGAGLAFVLVNFTGLFTAAGGGY